MTIWEVSVQEVLVGMVPASRPTIMLEEEAQWETTVCTPATRNRTIFLAELTRLMQAFTTTVVQILSSTKCEIGKHVTSPTERSKQESELMK